MITISEGLSIRSITIQTYSENRSDYFFHHIRPIYDFKIVTHATGNDHLNFLLFGTSRKKGSTLSAGTRNLEACSYRIERSLVKMIEKSGSCVYIDSAWHLSPNV